MKRPMSNTLDYATPRAPGGPSRRLAWAAIVSVVEHLFVFGLYAAVLDGGRLARMCAAVSVGFWLVVILIVVRRGHHPSKFDLAFVAFGYPAILFPCIYAVTGRL
jgi:hypothetical protein